MIALRGLKIGTSILADIIRCEKIDSNVFDLGASIVQMYSVQGLCIIHPKDTPLKM